MIDGNIGWYITYAIAALAIIAAVLINHFKNSK